RAGEGGRRTRRGGRRTGCLAACVRRGRSRVLSAGDGDAQQTDGRANQESTTRIHEGTSDERSPVPNRDRGATRMARRPVARKHRQCLTQTTGRRRRARERSTHCVTRGERVAYRQGIPPRPSTVP